VAYLRTCWRRCPARSPGLRTATVICFLCTSICRDPLVHDLHDASLGSWGQGVARGTRRRSKKLRHALAAATRGTYRDGFQRHSYNRTRGARCCHDSGRPTQFHPPVGAAAAASCSYKRGIRRFVTRLAYALKIYMPTG
jgi:hypothetical protein